MVVKLNNFIYGRRVKVLTDHKPILDIIKKCLNKVSARSQRMLLKLLKYSITIEYVYSAKVFVSDTLSTFHISDKVKNDLDIKDVIHTVEKYFMDKKKKKKYLKKTTLDDVELKKVTLYYDPGWLKNINRLKKTKLKDFYKIKKVININDNLVYFNNKIVVHKSLRPKFIRSLHESHLKLKKTRSVSRDIIYWPKIIGDIEKKINNCKTCMKYRKSNVKWLLHSHKVPALAFNKIALDILELNRKYYLFLVDYMPTWLKIN